MTSSIISASNVGKIFAVDQISGKPVRKLWALADVCFTVERGEIVGLIGRNGAGKSTLLKILSRIVSPTTGRIIITGRVGSLLEVGTGFHPELTGRENIFLNGALIGMRRAEVQRRFAEIVAFAEIDEFLDMPVKRYSSGMYTRLAFAVAAHLETEVLLVDEVLAVGDTAFQKKCLGKVGELTRGGRTIVLVTHNMAVIQNVCSRAILLKAGRIAHDGPVSEGVRRYLQEHDSGTGNLTERTDHQGSGELRVYSIEFKDKSGLTLQSVASGDDIEIWLKYRVIGRAPRNPTVGIRVNTLHDAPVFLHTNKFVRKEFESLPNYGAFVVRFPKFPLAPGMYRLSYAVMQQSDYIDRMSDALHFQVAEGDFFGTGEIPPSTHGVLLVDADWKLCADTVYPQGNL